MEVISMEEKQLDAIGEYVRGHLVQWLNDARLTSSEPKYQKNYSESEFSLIQRIVRVEEGIKHQGELLEKLIEQMEKQFEQVEKQFKEVEKKFEQADRKFEQIVNSIQEMQKDMNNRFEQMQKDMNIRFEQIRKDMDKSSQEMRNYIDRRFKQMFTFFTVGLGIIGIVSGVVPIIISIVS